MKTLSYNDKTQPVAGEDWLSVDPYSDDEIDRIQDPDGGLAETPRTAIPSPFAQLDLVKTAFRSVAMSLQRAPRMNRRLVSNALDVAQLLFDYENHRGRLRLVCWNRDERLKALLAAEQHRLYAETLQLFLRADKAYNFDRLNRWYIVLIDGQVVGGTSPASVFMAAPAVPVFHGVMVEQGVELFGTIRELYERDGDFIYYLFLLMNAYPDLRLLCPEVYAYMTACLPVLQRDRADVYQRITAVIANPVALDRGRAGELQARLDATFDAAPYGEEVGVLGAKFYSRRRLDIRAMAAMSDFVVRPSREQQPSAELPLVLKQGFKSETEAYRYLDREWDSATVVAAAGVPMSERLLPGTAVQYPFLTTADLLLPTIVRLPATIDNDHFLDGNLVLRAGDGCGYLLPVAPAYFDYFTAADLLGKTGGRDTITIESNGTEAVTVTLRVPVAKRYIELQQRYVAVSDSAWRFDETRGTGRIVDAAVDVAIFPMVRTDVTDDYTVQLFAMNNGIARASLSFHTDAAMPPRVSSKYRSRTDVFTTVYHDIAGAFDYVDLTLTLAAGDVVHGIIVPRWHHVTIGAKQLVFAVDFGTTNTHVEWSERDTEPRPLEFSASTSATLVASLLRRGGLDLADQVRRIEFLPPALDRVYGFPVRSAMLRPAVNDGQTVLFHDVSIPFLYERQYFSGYDVTTGLKWNGDKALAREFLRELVLLIKARVLLEQADPARTVVTYFYPVSMSGSDRRGLQDSWEELYRTYLGPDTSHLLAYPESIAPTFHYRGVEADAGSTVGVDIGGGTTDVVIYQPTADGLHSEAVAISSFRFAGNAIFGDAFDRPDAANNPLLEHYAAYFEQLAASDRTGQIAYISSILNDIRQRGRSEDVNAFLFSIENVEQLRSMREVDRNRYSYNSLLRADMGRKPVFLYFYTAIVYYVATAMRDRHMVLPREMFFSGTGSKILAIIGNMQQITDLTRTIFERVYGERFAGPFEVKIERDAPKQITCKGGIRLAKLHIGGSAAAQSFSSRAMADIKYSHPMMNVPGGEKQLSLSTLLQPAVRQAIVDSVKAFNRFFVDLLDDVARDDYGIDAATMRRVDEVINVDLDAYLTAGINAWLTGRYEPTDTIEDVPFFYPIAGAIRQGLLRHLGYNKH